ncbi:hypothetical protein [Vulgatibacter sp.]|uniref:hypothetical protein n=1 Tax=Vulgatibacter sp. TaxID=1971226 RepID=UPI003561D8CB
MAAWRWTVAAVVALSLGGCAMQATGRAPRHTGMGRDPSPIDVSALGSQEVEGRVRSVDSSKGIVVVEETDGTVPLTAATETSVFVDGGVGGFADLREGQPVRASYVTEDGKRIARWIEIPRPEDEDGERPGVEKAGGEVAR